MKKSFTHIEYLSLYEQYLREYLTDHWFVESRNRITKELPFSLQKRIEITVYYPNKSEYIYSNVFIVEKDIKLETLIDSIRHELTKKNPIEVFF